MADHLICDFAPGLQAGRFRWSVLFCRDVRP
jgi:hypothetical protein